MSIDCKKFIDSGKCKADCCVCFPLERDFWDKQKHNINPLLQIKLFDLLILDQVLPVTQDYNCVFLDRLNFTCTIYDERPSICKGFGIAANKKDISNECPHNVGKVSYLKEGAIFEIQSFIKNFPKELAKK